MQAASGGTEQTRFGSSTIFEATATTVTVNWLEIGIAELLAPTSTILEELNNYNPESTEFSP